MPNTLTKTFRRLSTELPAFNLPPQNTECEDAVLGAVMLEHEAMYAAQAIIKSADEFYSNANQCIWRAMDLLFHADKKIDIISLKEQLQRNGDFENAGGFEQLARLSNLVNSAANIQQHAMLVHEKYIARRLITITTECSTQGYNPTTDVLALLDNTTTQLDNLTTELAGNAHLSFAEKLAIEIEHLRNTMPNDVTGVPTYSPVLDAHTLGLQPENLVVIAGRPGMGKTSVAWHMAINQAKHGIPVGFFSLEMSDRELIHKMISAEISVNTTALRSGALTEEQWQRLNIALRQISTYPIHLNDTAGITLHQLLAQARNWVRKNGVKVIYIDYIGKIRTGDKKFGTREQEVSYISGTLKDFAKHMKIPVVLLSQLSRQVEHRTGSKRPLLSDLRDSGAVEQDADIVLFPYRPEYYGITSDGIEIYPKGYTELIIAKFRHGEPVNLRWIYEPEFSRFRDG